MSKLVASIMISASVQIPAYFALDNSGVDGPLHLIIVVGVGMCAVIGVQLMNGDSK